METAKSLFYSQHALALLFSATNKLQTQGDKRLQDITLRQMLAIPAILHAPDGEASINHIARQMGTTKQSAKQIVDAMAKKGYVAVAPSERDRRALRVAVTPRGEEAFRVCSGRTDAFLADIFDGFTPDELQALCALLQKLCRADTDAPAQFDATDAETILQHHQAF